MGTRWSGDKCYEGITHKNEVRGVTDLTLTRSEHKLVQIQPSAFRSTKVIIVLRTNNDDTIHLRPTWSQDDVPLQVEAIGIEVGDGMHGPVPMIRYKAFGLTSWELLKERVD